MPTPASLINTMEAEKGEGKAQSSDNACSIKGDVKENSCPLGESEEVLLDFQPLLAMPLTSLVDFLFSSPLPFVPVATTPVDVETRQAGLVVQLSQPWFYLRLVVYGFIGLSEGA